jgi:cell division protein FtsW
VSLGAPPGPPRTATPARPRPRETWLGWLDSPLTSYYLVLATTVALVVIGLVMVLSSSSVEAYRQTRSSYSVFARQAGFAALGMPLMVLACRLPVRAWKALSWPLMIVAVGGLLLVFSPLGVVVNANRNWVAIGSLTVQPAEAAKLALVVWAAAVLARKQRLLNRTIHVLVPVVVPGAVVLLGLVLAGRDLGTGLVLMALTTSLLYAAGAPIRVFVLSGGVAAAAVTLMVEGSTNRMSRIAAWLGGGQCDYLSTCWQSVHAKWALASGGWWGVGLGASREKWSWLPEAHNDFIFAIIGEELGLTGSLVVLGLFAALAMGLLRVVVRSEDLFVKIATGGVFTWVIGQAVINVGAVLGLLPVVGVPLPLVSSGGSALVSTMVALGMVIGFARREPGAAKALAARTGRLRRTLAVLPARRGRRGR